MKNRRKRILFPFLSGIVLLMAFGVSSSYAQSTAEFSGTWNTVTSKGKKLVVTLKSVDRRTSVTGTYARNGLTASYKPVDDSVTAFVKVSAIRAEPILQNISSITGTVTGNVLRFKWLEDGGRGAGRFTMSSDGQSFQGTISMTDNPDDTSGGTWSGTRAPNFAGVWRTKLGEHLQFPELLLQQAGSQVVGRLFAGRPEMGVIKEGIIDGNTLRFQVWRARSPMPYALSDQYVGSGELVMNADGKSFKGTLLGAATSGTLIARPGR
ncbi:hypothetical protein BH20ACI2_BH20ACI2_21860 [soil metagenome]